MKALIPCFVAVFAVVLLGACGRTEKSAATTYMVIEGKTMGTYWRATYADSLGRDFQQDINSLLEAVNQDISTYIKTSTISRFNNATDTIHLDEQKNIHFLNNFRMARQVFNNSGGAFDATIMPLVNYWGFGYTGKKPITAVDSIAIDSLIRLVDMNKVRILEGSRPGEWVLRKAMPGVQLDFGGTGQGYGVDVIAGFLASKGIRNYLSDIGGEQRTMGRSPRGDDWRIGINVPREGAAENEIQTAIPLVNRAISTSGNYRNFYEVNGVKYSHTINTKTGFPERNTLLSASVFAPDCLTADAYATAFMALGIDKAFQLASELPDVEGYFIFSKSDGSIDVRYTEGLAPLFSSQQQ